MKKQILTLTVCIALSAIAVLAFIAVHQKTTPVSMQTQPSSEKLVNAQQTRTKTIFNAKMDEHIKQIRAQSREHTYNTLGLSPEQRTKALAIELKRDANTERLFEKFIQELKERSTLKSKHASIFKIWQKEYEIYTTKNEIKNQFSNSKKEFEALLNKEQKNKFEADLKAAKKNMKNQPAPKLYVKTKNGLKPIQLNGSKKIQLGVIGPQGTAPKGQHSEKK